MNVSTLSEDEVPQSSDERSVGPLLAEVTSVSLEVNSKEEPPEGETPTCFTVHAEPPATASRYSCRKDFTGRSLEDLYILELCAGPARLSKAAHGQGFRTMAVDHSSSRTCGFPICILM